VKEGSDVHADRLVSNRARRLRTEEADGTDVRSPASLRAAL
jgi:hypothetical protein